MIPLQKHTLLSETDCARHSLHETFEYYAQVQPNATALIWGGKYISYSELNHEASSLAGKMMDRGVVPGCFIPILLSRSADLVISLLAVLKSGAAYALLDPGWPKNRIIEVIRTLTPPLVVTEFDSFSFDKLQILDPSAESSAKGHGRISLEVDPFSPSSVFFTSGTTGKPKGVISPHSGVLRLFKEGSFAIFNTNTVIPLAAALPWDAFSIELWGALLNGGTSWIIDEPYLSSNILRKGVANFSVNTIWMTSSLFNMVVEEDIFVFSGVQQIMIGGEKLSSPHVRKFIENHPHVTLINGYGPVESTVFATTHRISLNDCHNPSGIPIGSPVPETELYILNDQMQPCKQEEIGQICIGGTGLALGYINDLQLTNDKFLNICIAGKNTRIYQTGDLGVWKNGLFHFQGRGDRQVKIRGHRLELSEVECQIEKYIKGIKSCRVIARRDASNLSHELIAFCIPFEDGDSLDSAHDILKSNLVAYQCPTRVISVKTFPLTSQGKLNEIALLRMVPDLSNYTPHSPSSPHSYANSMETRIARVFSEVLRKESVAPGITLKALGANSLDIGRIASRLEKEFGFPVSLAWLYQYPTISALRRFLEDDNIPPLQLNPQNTSVNTMNHMQLMYLTQHLINPKNLISRCLMSWLIVGDLNFNALEEAIAEVHHKNRFLSATYTPDLNPDELAARFPPVFTILTTQTSEDEAIQSLRSELSRELDPTQGKVWRTAIIPIAGSTKFLFGCAIHHIAFDGFSEHLLANAISKSYNNVIHSTSEAMPTVSSYVSGSILTPSSIDIPLSPQSQVFINNLEDAPEIQWPNEPCDNVHVQQNNISNEHSVSINVTLLENIDKFARGNNLSRFEILFHAWALALAEVTEQDDFCIGVPVRQRSSSQSEKMINCCLNMLCIRFTKNTSGLEETSRIIESALSNQEIPFTQILQSVKPKQTGRTPLFQTLFALQDNPVSTLHLDGLETKFIRQSYLDLPLELHAEIWPEETRGLRLTISRRPEFVSGGIVLSLANSFTKNISQLIKL